MSSNAIVRYINLATLMRNTEPAAPMPKVHKSHRNALRKPAVVFARIDEDLANRYRNFRPYYYTASGLIECTLGKIDISPVTGETVAYYDLRQFIPQMGRWANTRYLYGLRNGQIKELKKFAIQYDR